MNSFASASCCGLACGVEAHAAISSNAARATPSRATLPFRPTTTSACTRSADHRCTRTRFVDKPVERAEARGRTPVARHGLVHEIHAVSLRVDRDVAAVHTET